MSYICTLCDYQTLRKNNFEKHLLTNKHKIKVNVSTNDKTKIPHPNEPKLTVLPPKKVKKGYTCAFCKLKYERKDNLTRHMKSCPMGQVHFIKKEYELKINYLQKNNKKMETEIKELKNTIGYFKNILGTTTETLDKSVSAYKFATSRYPEPTLLCPPIKYDLLYHNDDYPKIENGNYVDDNDKLIDTLTYEHSKKRLAKYIGDFVVRCYKKEGEDIKNQPLWNSDTSRLNYIIGVKINKENVWNIDKKGKKVKNLVIKPTLNMIKPILQNYVSSTKINSWFKNSYEIDKLKYASEIIRDIEEETLSDTILKYIAPFFYLHKDQK